LIQLQSESAGYHGVKTLHDINLHIVRGEKLALVGQSGSGKSTLLKLIYEHHPVDTALIPQDYGLVNHLSVYHNVFIGRLGQHSTGYNLINLIRPWPNQVVIVRSILLRLQLDDYLFRPVGRLSGGQKQRVAVARSLFQQGLLLLADEPVSSVDEQQSKVVLKQLRDGFSTMVLAMHDIQLALTFCSRIIGMEKGRIVLDSPCESITKEDLLSLY
jgi:phosphonate transport system ATP-binding protein